MTDATHRQIKEGIRELSGAIGLRAGFYEGLLEQGNDWVFVVQLQVIAEAAIAQKVVAALKQDKAFDHVSRLAFDGKTGKLQLALSLGLLDADSADALRALSACRNHFAHRLGNVGRTLENFGQSLDAATRLDLLKRLGALEPGAEGEDPEAAFADFGARLRHRLWLATAIALARLADAGIHSQLVQLRRELEQRQQGNLDTPAPVPRNLLDFQAKGDAGHVPEARAREA